MRILLLGLCVGCAQEKGNVEASEDDVLAEDLWGEIADYESWNQLEGWEGIVPSESTHGASVQIWLNDLAAEALANGETVPDGGILVKEGFNDAEGTDPKAITVMKKIADYNADAGDWFWGAYDVDGTVSVSGKADFCISCHASGDDYLVFVTMDAPE